MKENILKVLTSPEFYGEVSSEALFKRDIEGVSSLSKLHRALDALVEEGFLIKDGTDSYLLSDKALVYSLTQELASLRREVLDLRKENYRLRNKPKKNGEETLGDFLCKKFNVPLDELLKRYTIDSLSSPAVIYQRKRGTNAKY
jgi:hypothetical protein